MKFGLEDKHITLLKKIFVKYPLLNEIVLYGSRAKGNYTDMSDIDFVIRNSIVDRHLISQVLLDIDDSNLPYSVDLQDFSKLKNKQLIDHINRVGKIFYKKENAKHEQ